MEILSPSLRSGNSSSEMPCPLCASHSLEFYQDSFRICTSCEGIFRVSQEYPTPEEEKMRYLSHNNDVTDAGYQKFVSPITEAVMHHFGANSLGLDFGAGPGPVAAKVLGDKGYALRLYDPFFHDNKEVLLAKYDYIICCEVMEHFFEPAKEFALLKGMLKPHGKLFCMTHLFDPSINFADWYYKNDITHVFFYQASTLMKIQSMIGFSGLRVDARLIIFE